LLTFQQLHRNADASLFKKIFNSDHFRALVMGDGVPCYGALEIVGLLLLLLLLLSPPFVATS